MDDDEVGSDAEVSLREVTAETLRDVCKLSDTLTPPKSEYVASNVYSIAEASFKVKAWFRAVYADSTAVGFLMLHDEGMCEKPREKGYFFLWRMMIDQRYQRMGFGARALLLLIDHVKNRPDAAKLHTSWRQEEGNAGAFYEKLGFTVTGIDDTGEVQAFLDL